MLRLSVGVYVCMCVYHCLFDCVCVCVCVAVHFGVHSVQLFGLAICTFQHSIQ